MTNAVGYFHGEREEKLAEGFGMNSIDINRDFPYNQESENGCMNSVAARVIY